jgi:hypothetical protein
VGDIAGLQVRDVDADSADPLAPIGEAEVPKNQPVLYVGPDSYPQNALVTVYRVLLEGVDVSRQVPGTVSGA